MNNQRLIELIENLEENDKNIKSLYDQCEDLKFDTNRMLNKMKNLFLIELDKMTPNYVNSVHMLQEYCLRKHNLMILDNIIAEKFCRYKKHDKQNEEENIDSKCIICLSKPNNIRLLPCKHIILCNSCSNDCNDRCPLDRSKIESKIDISNT